MILYSQHLASRKPGLTWLAIPFLQVNTFVQAGPIIIINMLYLVLTVGFTWTTPVAKLNLEKKKKLR
jgi:hypothetical protein